MAKFSKNLKYYYLGEFVACIMLKGVIHPDMQEDNIGYKDGKCVLMDYSDIDTFKFPDGLDLKVVNRLTDALFPPLEKILKNFELMSFFRAGFISVGGLLGKAIFDNVSNNGISSFEYISTDLKRNRNDSSYLFTPVNKKLIKEWKNIILNELGYEKSGNIDTKSIPFIIDNVSDENSFYMNQLLVLKTYVEKCEAEEYKEFWMGALHFACESIKRGYFYTGYGILRKVLHMSKYAHPLILMYHAKVDEMLEGKSLLESLKHFIENNLEYNFFQVLWILNDIDYFNLS